MPLPLPRLTSFSGFLVRGLISKTNQLEFKKNAYTMFNAGWVVGGTRAFTVFQNIAIYGEIDVKCTLHPFFSQLSFADFMMFDFLDQLRTFEPVALDPFKNIKDFMARIEVRESHKNNLMT